MENAAERYGERFAPPVILRRLVAQGRLGQKSGQGFYAYPQPDAEQPAEAVKLESRGEIAIAWLANGQMNSISPQVVEDLRKVWEQGLRVRRARTRDRLLQPVPVQRRRGHQGVHDDRRVRRRGARPLGPRAVQGDRLEHGIATIAAVNGLAFGGGCELAMACDVRIAARSAMFGQPEIKLGIIPGFGGTQRLPRLVGVNKALEMNLVGDPILAEEAFEFGLVNRVVEDHELLDTALSWARKLAAQAPLAMEQIKRVSAAGDLDEGIEAEKKAFATVFTSADAKEGIAAFLGKRQAHFKGA